MKRLVLLAALSGCATVPMARNDLTEQAKEAKAPPDAARVYVYRPGNVVGAAVKLQVFLDEVRIGALAPRTFAVLVVRPGEHKLLVRAKGSADQVIIVEPGHDYYVKAAPAFGWDGPNASVELVKDEKAARSDIHNCGLIANLAATASRDIAAEIARVNVDGIRSDDLIAGATRALQAMDARPGDSEGSDLEATISRLRDSHPGLDDQQLIFVAARSMVSAVRGEQADQDRDDSRAVDRNCGVTLRRQGHEIVIANVLPNSPAAEVGLEAGFELREVDGHPTRDQPPAAIARMLAGTPGTPVALTVGKPAAPDRRVVVRRAPVDEGAVECRVVQGRVLYLQPWGLSTATGRRVRDHGRSQGAAARLVILDLRDNYGGPVDAGQDFADSFLTGGTMFSVSGARIPNVDKTYAATAGTSALEDARLVVLVNGNTSGSAEAIAAAVQDHHRGVVLGSKTAGKATVDLWYRIGSIQVRIPVARLLRASGQPISGAGVIPDSVDGALGANPSLAMQDVACSNVASTATVSDDPLVQRAAGWLLASPR